MINPTKRRALLFSSELSAAIACARIGQHGRERGVTALEFAIILPVFLAFIFMVFQLGMIFAAQEMLDNATRDVARSMRIGTITGSGSSYATNLKSAICSNFTANNFNLIPCNSTTLQLYVAAAASGTPAGTGFTQLTTATVSASHTFSGTPASLLGKYDVVLQLGYYLPWNISLGSGGTMLISTAVFQTEPY